jgi:hypothetical protein
MDGGPQPSCFCYDCLFGFHNFGRLALIFFNIVTQVLGTACEELSTDSVVLLYVSASGIGLLSASLYSWTIQRVETVLLMRQSVSQ